MRIIKKAFLIFCCWSLFCQIDGPVFFVQTIAWAKMFYSAAQQDPLKLALKKTFDGQHPCRVCKKLANLQAQSPQLKALSFAAKIKIFAFSRSLFELAPEQIWTTYGPSHLFYFDAIDISPPKPPPRIG